MYLQQERMRGFLEPTLVKGLFSIFSGKINET